jgi:hypothetical protein
LLFFLIKHGSRAGCHGCALMQSFPQWRNSAPGSENCKFCMFWRHHPNPSCWYFWCWRACQLKARTSPDSENKTYMLKVNDIHFLPSKRGLPADWDNRKVLN